MSNDDRLFPVGYHLKICTATELLPEGCSHWRTIPRTERLGLNNDDQFRRVCRNRRTSRSIQAFVAMKLPLRTICVILVIYSQRLANPGDDIDQMIQVCDVCYQ